MSDMYDYQLFYECHLHEMNFENKIHALEYGYYSGSILR